MFVLCCGGYYYSTSFTILILTSFMTGMIHQLFVVVMMEILTKKYPKSYLEHVGKVFSSYSLVRAVWTVLILRIMNPLNQPTSLVSHIDGHDEFYYPASVSGQFPYLLYALAAYGIFTTTFLGIFLDDPTFKESSLYKKVFNRSLDLGNGTGQLLLDPEQPVKKSRRKSKKIKWFSGFRSFYFVPKYVDGNLGSEQKQRVRFYSTGTNIHEHAIQLRELQKVSFFLILSY